MPMKVSYLTPCRRQHLRDIRQFVHQHIEQTGMSDVDRHKVVLAIDEACANAILHGNDNDASRQLQIDLFLQKSKLKVEIYDVGDYRPEKKKWSMADIDQHVKEKRKGGLGLCIMYRIMDSVSFFPRKLTAKQTINVCALVKSWV